MFWPLPVREFSARLNFCGVLPMVPRSFLKISVAILGPSGQLVTFVGLLLRLWLGRFAGSALAGLSCL